MFPVEEPIMEEEEISWAVCRLRLNRSGDPLGMKAENLRKWLISATRDNTPDATKWKKAVVIVQE